MTFMKSRREIAVNCESVLVPFDLSLKSSACFTPRKELRSRHRDKGSPRRPRRPAGAQSESLVPAAIRLLRLCWGFSLARYFHAVTARR